MATNTTNYNWVKPSYEDDADIQVINGTIDAIDAQMKSNEDNITVNRTAISQIIDSGAKNVIQVDELGLSSTHGTTYTNEGVQFVLNSDGSVTCTRSETSSNTALCNLRYDGGAFYANSFCDGNHVLAGCPSGGGVSTYRLEAHGTTNNSYDVQDNGNGVELTSYTGAANIIIRIRISPDYSPNGLVIKPMICTKAAWNISQNYVPYRPSYDELIARVTALENA